jgi:hypothetical protein
VHRRTRPSACLHSQFRQLARVHCQFRLAQPRLLFVLSPRSLSP